MEVIVDVDGTIRHFSGSGCYRILCLLVGLLIDMVYLFVINKGVREAAEKGDFVVFEGVNYNVGEYDEPFYH